MGRLVKHLIEHLRIRQGTHGVNAFTFTFTQDGNDMQPASYPTAAAEAIAAGIKVLDWPVVNTIKPAVVADVILDASSSNMDQGTKPTSQPAPSDAAAFSEVSFKQLLLLVNILNRRYRPTLRF